MPGSDTLGALGLVLVVIAFCTRTLFPLGAGGPVFGLGAAFVLATALSLYALGR